MIEKLAKPIKWTARLGTGLLLIVLVFSCATVPGLRDETGGTYIRVPFVRVLLEDSQPNATISGDGQFAVECLQDGVQSVYYSTRPVKVTVYSGRLDVENDRGQVLASRQDEINLIPRGSGNLLRLDKERYRGLIKTLPAGQNVKVINVLYVEDYLYGVVPPEIGPREESELEAIKAQAVAARTYTISHLQQYPNEPYDLKNTIIDQVYNGVEAENRLVDRAVNETAGQVMTYEGKFIDAYYHSTCGGMTDAISAVWDRKEIPYLKAVSDSGACSWSKYYTWKEVFTEKQLRGRLEQYLSSDRGRDMVIGKVNDIKIMERTPGGRVAKLMVRTDNDVYRFQKDRIRWVIGRTSNPDLILPSGRFDVDIERDPLGNLVSVTFNGRGYGHGVGMCQCGAIGLARDGWSYDRILKHYYTGVEITKPY
ncbi:MAG TPA: SpoIID/LytB domain-containing protein [candidate division Zixibacteria bacterium]|nr:SpoIID/LytB domain-containing protein [candidate division Zixibacteria bacterium]